MKILGQLALASMLLFGFTTANAQQASKHSKKQSQEVNTWLKKQDFQKKWKEELGLTDEQTTQIQTIRAKRAEELKALREQIITLKKEERAELAQVYTPEQKEKLERMKSARKGKMQKHYKHQKRRAPKGRTGM